MDKRILIIFFLLLICTRALSAVFVVTSNADSGPGTLRNALTQAAANGNATIDYINFNLADQSVAGRTITLLSNLPAITSDVIIDGSTQPGTLLSVNGAKVIVGGNYTSQNSYIDYFLIQNVNNVEIDGLIIKSFFPEPYDIYNGVAAIIIDGNNNTITLGQPGKGNVIYNCSQSIQSEAGVSPYFPDKSATQNFICKNNLIGVKEDGIATDGNPIVTAGTSPSEIILSYVYNITLGGDTKAEGNVFFATMAVSPSYLFDTFSQNVNYKIRNNIFGANAQQQVLNPNPNFLSLGVDPNLTYNQSTAISITDNVFGYTLAVNGFQLLNLQVQRNFFGVSSDLKNKLPINLSAIQLTYMQGTILVGGTDISQQNIFTNCAQSNDVTVNTTAVVQVSTFSPTVGLDPLFNIELSHNSFYCNNGPPFIYNIAPEKKPLNVTVDNLTPTSVSGTTKPNARVELFYTDKECTQCQPKTFITSTNADANGKWAYNAPLQAGYGVMAGATLNHVSSEFTDTRIYAFAPYTNVTNSECGNNGKIEGTLVVNAKNIAWLDENNNVVGTSVNLENVGPGKYTLRAGQFGCVIHSSPITIADITPVFNTQYMQVTQPSCGNPGSISGIIATNAWDIKWLDGSGNIIRNSFDITNLAPGSYTLQITGLRGCIKTYGPVTITPETNSLALDESKVQITLASCSMDNGSITGIQIAGNAQYKWVDANNKTVATTADLKNAAPGDYFFTAYNQFGCSQTSKTYHIGALPPTQYPVYSNIITAACANTNNGSVNVTTDALAKSARWVNSQGATVGNTVDLSNVPSGVYGLYLTDQNGCETFYNNFTVDEISPIQILQSSAQIVNDQCTLGLGSIKGIEVAGGQLPYNYTWTDASGNVFASAPDITGLSAGSYTLTVKDARGCNLASEKYTIQDIENILPAPSADNIQLCSPAITFLIVNDPFAGDTYNLYNNDNDPTPIDTQPGGKFKIDAQSNRKYYVSRARGSCESSRTEVSVTVGISGINIANTITPNGDGINDYWNITGIQNYPGCLVQVFTRYGQKVFESKGYTHPFDGTFGGSPLPVGVYYYIINLNTNCNLLSGSLTIIR